MAERPTPEAARQRTDPRIRRRRAAVARSKRRRLILGASAVLAVGLVVWGLFFSPLLDVREVKVTGAHFTTEEEVARAAGLLDPDQNLLLLPTGEIAEKVEELPWVKDADVDRMLPGTVRIKISERKPAMILSLGAARWTIDPVGNVLATGEAIEGLPVLAGVEVGDIEPGLKLMTEEGIAALEVYRSLPRSIVERLTGLFAPTTERISLVLTNGTTVRYGAAESIHDKNEVLKVLLARLDGEGRAPAYIDVRVPTSPAVSESGAPTASPTPSPSPSPSD